MDTAQAQELEVMPPENNQLQHVSTPQLPAEQQPQSDAQGIMAIIEKACMNENFDVNKLEKLMDLQKRILDRDAEMAFNADFADMQAELPIIDEKGQIKVGAEVRSKYAMFEDINEACKPALKKYGFGITFVTKQEGALITATVTLRHKKGFSLSNTSLPLPSDTSGSKNAVQALGSTQSYAMRQALRAILNISSRAPIDRDDDAQSAAKFLDNEKAVEIDMMITDALANKKQFLEFMGADDVRKILAKDYVKAKNALNQKKKKAEAANKKENVNVNA